MKSRLSSLAVRLLVVGALVLSLVAASGPVYAQSTSTTGIRVGSNIDSQDLGQIINMASVVLPWILNNGRTGYYPSSGYYPQPGYYPQQYPQQYPQPGYYPQQYPQPGYYPQQYPQPGYDPHGSYSPNGGYCPPQQHPYTYSR